MSSKFIPGLILAVLTFSGGTIALHSVSTHPAVESFPDPAVDMDRSATKGKRTAVVAGGCFWCTEAVFEQMIGVEKVVSGYAGGKPEMAHYKMVSYGKRTMRNLSRSRSTPQKFPTDNCLRFFSAWRMIRPS